MSSIFSVRPCSADGTVASDTARLAGPSKILRSFIESTGFAPAAAADAFTLPTTPAAAAGAVVTEALTADDAPAGSTIPAVDDKDAAAAEAEAGGSDGAAEGPVETRASPSAFSTAAPAIPSSAPSRRARLDAPAAASFIPALTTEGADATAEDAPPLPARDRFGPTFIDAVECFNIADNARAVMMPLPLPWSTTSSLRGSTSPLGVLKLTSPQRPRLNQRQIMGR